jgi:hypothetical protein
MKRVKEALWHFFAKAESIASAFTTLFVAPVTMYHIEKDSSADDHPQHHDEKSSSGKNWIETRGYVDSFSKEDELDDYKHHNEGLLIVDQSDLDTKSKSNEGH